MRKANTNLESARSVVNQVISSPIKTSIQILLPYWVNSLAVGSYKTDTLELAAGLYRMGLDQDFLEFTKILKDKNNDNIDRALDYLYGLFDHLSKNKPKENDQAYVAELKKLKKLIHQFARNNDRKGRLFNSRKLALQKDKLDKKSQLSQLSKEEKDQLELINSVLPSARNLKYAYISNEKLEPVTTESERTQRRRVKFILNVTSFLVTLIVAAGQAVVGAAFVLGTASPLSVLFLTVIPVFICNYVLFRGDSFQILKDIGFRRIIKKMNGDSMSKGELALLGISAFFSLCGAVMLGLVVFSSTYGAADQLKQSIGLCISNGVLAGFSGLLGVVTGAAMFSVFISIVASWIRNDGPRKLIHSLLNLRTTLSEFLFAPNWNRLSAGQKTLHVIRRLLAISTHLLFFALAVVTSVVVASATTGLFNSKLVYAFYQIFHFTPNALTMLLHIGIMGFGGLSNALLYARGISTVFSLIKQAVFSLAAFILNPSQGYTDLKKQWGQTYDLVTSSYIRLIDRVCGLISGLFLFGCIVQNAAAQTGVARNTNAFDWTQKVVPFGPRTVTELIKVSTAGGSFGVNGICGAQTLQIPSPIHSGQKALGQETKRLLGSVGFFPTTRGDRSESRSSRNVGNRLLVAC